MKGTEVPNPWRSGACEFTCVLTRIDHRVVTLSCLSCALCFVPAYAEFAYKFLTLFHSPRKLHSAFVWIERHAWSQRSHVFRLTETAVHVRLACSIKACSGQ